MSKEETKAKGFEDICKDAGCGPENFKEICGQMKERLTSGGDAHGCGAMMKSMMEAMTASGKENPCCRPASDKAKAEGCC